MQVNIDDWAKRRGHTYSTIVVDLDRRCPIEVLEDRSSKLSPVWLKFSAVPMQMKAPRSKLRGINKVLRPENLKT